MSFKEVGAYHCGRVPVIGVAFGVLARKTGNLVNINLGAELCEQNQIKAGHFYKFLWGAGPDEGQLKLVPHQEGRRVSPPSSGGTMRVTSTGMPDWLDSGPANLQSALYAVNADVILITIPPDFIKSAPTD